MARQSTDTALVGTYARLTGADPQDGPDPAEARNGVIHVLSLALTKTADGLIDPKLVLAWLLNALGAPGFFIGLLVPVREAGALLPQLALAQAVERSAARRRFWSAGSALQGLAALGIAAAAWTLEGWAAGVTIVALLAILAVARAAASISYKDALARTIPKRRRGAVTGLSASVASASVLAFGALLAAGLVPLTVTAIGGAIALAGAFWLAASAAFLRLDERGDAAGGSDDPSLAALVEPLIDDAQLRRFIAARALLTATALAPPFLLLLSSAGGNGPGLGQLGPFILASAAASILSGYVWGRLSDRSSRLTLVAAAALAALALAAAAAVGLTLGSLGGIVAAVGFVFVAQIAYEGVRAGRKLHLTDMAGDAERARYTALSNSLIGVVLVLGGGLGLISDAYGPAVVLAVLALLCLLAIPLAAGLDEVQTDAE